MLSRLRKKHSRICKMLPIVQSEWESLGVSSETVQTWIDLEAHILTTRTTNRPRTKVDFLEDKIRGHVVHYYDLNHHRTLEQSLPEGTKTQGRISRDITTILEALNNLLVFRHKEYSHLPLLSLKDLFNTRSLG